MAINQVIYCVSEGPFSIEFITCCKKQMLQRYWKFAGYITIWRERAAVKDEGQCFIMISLPVYMSGRGDPIGWCLGFDRICITLIFSHDYPPRTMFWYSDSETHRTKGAAQIIWHFPVIENKAKIVMKHHNKKLTWTPFIIGLFSLKKNPQHNNLFDCSCLISLTLRFLNMFSLVMTDCRKMSSLFPCSDQMLKDLVECQQAGTKREIRGQELVWICPFRLMLQLIDARVCGELLWTHLLVVSKSAE